MHGAAGDEGITRECTYVLANPWAPPAAPAGSGRLGSSKGGATMGPPGSSSLLSSASSSSGLSAETARALVEQGVVAGLVGLLSASTPPKILKVSSSVCYQSKERVRGGRESVAVVALVAIGFVNGTREILKVSVAVVKAAPQA